MFLAAGARERLRGDDRPHHHLTVSAIYGAVASVGIGVGDHITRGAAEQGGIRRTLSGFFFIGVPVAAAGAIAFGSEWRADDVILGCLTGVVAAAALGALYMGYSSATAGVVGPPAAVVSVALPVVVDFTGGSVPSSVVVAGIVLGVMSVLLISFNPHMYGNLRRGLSFGLLAGVCYGCMYIMLDQLSAEGGFWPIVGQRGVAFAILAAISIGGGDRVFPESRAFRTAALGAVWTGIGALFFVYGLQHGDLAPVTVAGSQYAAVTVVCGMVFRGERLRWWQAIGLSGAVSAVALIVVG